MMTNDLAELVPFISAVRRNCHITDARHARQMSMCNYLLEMREFYRWEQGLPFGVEPPHAEVGAWLSAREALWEDLDGEDFGELPFGSTRYEPFALDEINVQLLPYGLHYGAGIGRFGKPHFFLARKHDESRRDGVNVFVCDREYARDISTIPAALQGRTIVVRREALRRWLWERAEAWDMKRRAGTMQTALDAYGFAADADAAVDRMMTDATETLVLHELGEHAAGCRLGPAWEEMLSSCDSKRAEVLARAVRDNLADCLSTLPALIARNAGGSLHLWFSNFDGMRLALFARLSSAYADWQRSGDAQALTGTVELGQKHWSEVAHRLLEIFAQRGSDEMVTELERLSGKPDEISLA